MFVVLNYERLFPLQCKKKITKVIVNLFLLNVTVPSRHSVTLYLEIVTLFPICPVNSMWIYILQCDYSISNYCTYFSFISCNVTLYLTILTLFLIYISQWNFISSNCDFLSFCFAMWLYTLMRLYYHKLWLQYIYLLQLLSLCVTISILFLRPRNVTISFKVTSCISHNVS